jgi:hypothetical protein
MFSREPKLHPEIISAVQGRSNFDMPSYYAPDEGFNRVIAAACLLRKGQHQNVKPLASKPLPERENEQTIDNIFRSIVNQSLDKTPHEQGIPSRLRRRSESTCSAGEVHFGTLINNMSQGLYPHTAGGRLVIDQGQPLFLQKNIGEQTFLSLKDATISGITYPAGSLIGVHLSRDKQEDTGRFERQHIPTGQIEIVDAQEIEGANFLRPSLLALRPEERSEHFDRPEFWGFHKSIHPEALQTIAHISVAQVADLAMLRSV